MFLFPDSICFNDWNQSLGMQINENLMNSDFTEEKHEQHVVDILNSIATIKEHSGRVHSELEDQRLYSHIFNLE